MKRPRLGGLVGGQGGAVSKSLGAMLRSIASLAQDLSSNIREVSGLEGLLAIRATEAVRNGAGRRSKAVFRASVFVHSRIAILNTRASDMQTETRQRNWE